jgi:hypothetical protein
MEATTGVPLLGKLRKRSWRERGGMQTFGVKSGKCLHENLHLDSLI